MDTFDDRLSQLELSVYNLKSSYESDELQVYLISEAYSKLVELAYENKAQVESFEANVKRIERASVLKNMTADLLEITRKITFSEPSKDEEEEEQQVPEDKEGYYDWEPNDDDF